MPYFEALPDGSEGDFIRFNAATGGWEVASDPLAVKGLTLTPQATAPSEDEGTVYYSSDDGKLYCKTKA